MRNGVLSYLAWMARPWFESCKSCSSRLVFHPRLQFHQVILFAANRISGIPIMWGRQSRWLASYYFGSRNNW